MRLGTIALVGKSVTRGFRLPPRLSVSMSMKPHGCNGRPWDVIHLLKGLAKRFQMNFVSNIKMLESQSEDALVLLVKLEKSTVETVRL